MNIGRTCPRCQDLGLLYPKSTRLRAALYEYFIGLVEICKKAVLFIRRPLICQVSSSLLKPFFDSEFGGLQQTLDQLASTIREEASLASQQEIVKWHKQDARSQKAMIEWQKQRAKNRFLDAYSSYNYQTAWKQARKKGNTDWIHSVAEYKQWKQDKSSSTLWLTGIMGSGKTVLSANIVDDLALTAPQAMVAYFFSRYDDVESLQARNILGSIARQVLERFIRSEIPHSEGSYDTDQILTYLESALSSNSQKCFIIIDGLDECDSKEIKELLNCLKRLLQSSNLVQIYCSSRSDLLRWAPAILNAQWNISMPKVNPELEQYIEETLKKRLEERSLKLRDPANILNIMDALVKKAHGMSVLNRSRGFTCSWLTLDRYLWVDFQIVSICSQKTDNDILAALKDLPKDLPETYDRILDKIQKSPFADQAFARRVFGLLATVRHPLTLDALREAVSVEPGVTLWDPRKMVNDMLSALNCCGSLVIVDEEELTVRFAHHSVKQYLLVESTKPAISRYHVNLNEAASYLGDICVTYLNMGIFDKRLERATPKLQISSAMLAGTLPPSNLVNKLALKYLKNRRETRRDVRLCLEDIAGSSVQPTARADKEFHFLAYAKDNWLFHTKAFRPTRTREVYRLWCNLVNGEVDVVDLPWTPENYSEVGSKFICWITQEYNEALAHLAFDYLVITERHINIANKVMRLIRIIPVESQIDNRMLLSLLHLAASVGHVDLVQCLLKKRVDANSEWRAFGDHTAVPSTVLQEAAARGHEFVVQLLLEHGADVNAHGGHYGYALQTAASAGYESIVRLLLDHGADVNASGGGHGNALYASLNGYVDQAIVKLLLDRGAKVTAAHIEYSRLSIDKAIPRLLESYYKSSKQC